ncbi:MTL5 protein, partial [Bucorvus abyssinicus]|nr:MTL5 protein [Bucorvus abyssinicus]
MENQILVDVASLIDSGLVTEILSRNSSVPAENFHLGSAGTDNPTEEALLPSQDTANVGETLLDHNYSWTTENQNTIVKAEVRLYGNNNCDDEDLEKYKELNLPEEADHAHSPGLPSDGAQFLSSVAMQRNNCGVPTSSIFSPEGTVDQNVRMIPVRLSEVDFTNSRLFILKIPGVLQPGFSRLSVRWFEACPETRLALWKEVAEVREAVSNVVEKHQGRAIFQSSDVDESGCMLLALHCVAEESRCSHRNYSNPGVICQLEGGTQMLCINSCGAEELKLLRLVPEYHNQHDDLQSDGDNPVTAELGQFSPVLCEVVLNKQEVTKLHPLSLLSTIEFFFLFLKWVVKSVLLYGLGVTKSKKPCNCTKPQHCDCFANGDFCNNCNCNNCYNNQLHEAERFKAIKSCLDRNPEAFLPKMEKGKLGEINPHHNKGCNCKHTGCLKSYCECFEAKMMCSSICKCIGCKNYEENGLKVLNYTDVGKTEGNSPVLTSTFETLPTLRTDRQPAVCISWEEVKAVCTCLLMEAEEAEERGYSGWLAEWMIMEEFGRCLSQILHAQLKSK